MPIFAAIGIDHPTNPASLREELRPEHREYVLGHDAPIRFAGSMFDKSGKQSGSLLLFEADNAEEIADWFRKEPFYRGGAYKDFHILELRVAINLIDSTGGWVTSYDNKPAATANVQTPRA